MDAITTAMSLTLDGTSDAKVKYAAAASFHLMGYLAGIFQSSIRTSFEFGFSDENMRDYFYNQCNAYPEKTVGETGAAISDDLNR